ncbi:serine carboxypeptidase-like 45 isoform X1 [Vicia villosa]|uniref:serine carboxypeptidase-like 45 isoform X1 n=1 Tax=Vicia villosa TaxID=3911 RepID=UPI00273BBCDA|nr:serine carboxypeptidase-like 45 isoform X1 [Vicia villosa]
MFNKLLTFLFLFVFISSIRGNSGYEKYKILSMNSQPSVVDFNQFAGFITVDYKNGRSLFFYFVEAEADPASKPVFLWINNAGPGCSSYGTIFEKGPFRPTSEGGFVKNPHSWNQVANMLYLDAPAGFGFSYSNNTADYSLVLNDDFAARDNLVFLHHWFDEFSHYKSNDLYIGGEKNAARLAANLAELIVKNNESFNLQGVVVGNFGKFVY